MIEFVLDGRSKANTYAQLVQQVKQALRVGLLAPGDQLPKVRDVAQSLAIDPEHGAEGVPGAGDRGSGVGGRPGVGTFVTRTRPNAQPGRAARGARRPGSRATG